MVSLDCDIGQKYCHDQMIGLRLDLFFLIKIKVNSCLLRAYLVLPNLKRRVLDVKSDTFNTQYSFDTGPDELNF